MRAGEVDYARIIKPMFAKHCYECHGPQKQKGGLRLDSRQEAFSLPKSKKAVVHPGDATQSEVIRRVTSSDEDEQMPPRGSRLSEVEAGLLRDWINQGASWPIDEPALLHWAFEKPVRVELPEEFKNEHPVDAFVFDRLSQDGLLISQPTAPENLLRRLSLSLIGLPPPLKELDAFLSQHENDPEAAVSAAVDRLLGSPHFGERWARPWLDAARYADSHGFQRDDLRDLWLFRDWVIRALNENKPFSEFTIEQLAGDLLVNKSLDAALSEEEIDLLTATGFHRCTPTNVEAGTDQEEERVNQVFDRVNTTSMVWMGVTMECAQCHDHKYDPLTTRDYYSMFAYFNNAPQETEFLNEKSKASLRFKGPYLTLPGEREANTDPQDPDDAKKGEKRKKGEIRHYRRTLVMQDSEQRPTHILNRGSFLDPGEAIFAATPGLFDTFDPGTTNRLGLARWLVSDANPLTARVIVNRFWAELFGRGIVSTPEDFGIKGEPPTHPEMLDWLAVEFVESGWDVKRLIRLIVTSRTFQQSAATKSNPKAAQLDALNKSLWRFPRQRLSAESVRDNALAISGLLSRKRFGPPVRPPQPDGLWRKVGGEAYQYETSEGEDRHRRGIYSIRKRGGVNPSFAAFDASARTSCAVQRRVSNTPLQALTLLNDPVFVEAAEALGEQLRTGEGTIQERLTNGFRMCTSRQPERNELKALQALLRTSRNASPSAHVDKPGPVAWVDVAAALLNLDETITVP
jgi:hypothetical protein